MLKLMSLEFDTRDFINKNLTFLMHIKCTFNLMNLGFDTKDRINKKIDILSASSI